MTPDRYQGLLYRALNPVYAREPLSGRGAALYGGRFNERGIATLYTSLRLETAIREANQVGNLQPTTIVAYTAELGPIFDTRQEDALSQYGMTPAVLADDSWRANMLAGAPVPTQEFATRLIADGFAGLIVRSYASGAEIDHLNLVLWRWNVEPFGTLRVIDDEGRLTR